MEDTNRTFHANKAKLLNMASRHDILKISGDVNNVRFSKRNNKTVGILTPPLGIRHNHISWNNHYNQKIFGRFNDILRFEGHVLTATVQSVVFDVLLAANVSAIVVSFKPVDVWITKRVYQEWKLQKKKYNTTMEELEQIQQN